MFWLEQIILALLMYVYVQNFIMTLSFIQNLFIVRLYNIYNIYSYIIYITYTAFAIDVVLLKMETLYYSEKQC